MATSAFRSTTRRSTGTNANGVPDTPRSKRDPSPSGRGLHRRSSSMTDFSARYLSDCSSTSNYRSSLRRSLDIHGGRRSVCPSDSENEQDFSSVRRSRRTAESEDERTLKPSNTGSKASEAERRTSRRSSSSRDMPQYCKKSERVVIGPDNKPGTGDSDDLVEEKTIRAVFDQMKSMQLEPPVADAGMTNFLDSMKAEVRRAVLDIRTELEEALQENVARNLSSDEGHSRAEASVVIRSVADIQNEYTAKLEESEKKVRELWSQIAVEERRCLELSKIVNELLPTSPPICLETSAPQVISSGRRPRRRNSSERQLALESLDVEAQKYFEECVSISSFECDGDSDESMLVKESIGSSKAILANSETAIDPATGHPSANDSSQTKDLLVGSDGVVLPWLKWEAEAGGVSDKGAKLATKKHTSPRASSSGARGSSNRATGSNDQFYRSGGVKSSGGRRSGGTSPLFETNKQTSLASIPLFTIDDNTVKVDQPLDVDKFLFDKIQVQCRVNNGELLLCQSCFLI